MPALTNRPTLEQIDGLPIGEIAAMPAEHLALLQDEAAEALRRAKTASDWLDGAVALKYADRAHSARQAAGKDTGAVRFEDGDFTVVADLSKRVEWDQDRLGAIVERIRAAGDDPARYVNIAIKVPERKYAAWPDAIRRVFEPARTVGTGALKIELLPRGGRA